jgi:hypothetical protein
MDGKSLLENLSELKESLQDYIETRVSYYGMLALEKTVRLLTRFLSAGLLIAVLLLAMLFLSAAGALYIGSLLGRLEFGLLVVGGFYLLLAFLIYLLRNRLLSSFVTRSLVNTFFGDEAEGD